MCSEMLEANVWSQLRLTTMCTLKPWPPNGRRHRDMHISLHAIQRESVFLGAPITDDGVASMEW